MQLDGVLILSHVGFSFVDDLISALRERDLQAWVLTSKPLGELGAERLQGLSDKASTLFATDSHELTREDVAQAVASLRARGLHVRGCVTVWEGYRALMAYANGLVGATDLTPAHIESLRNKLHVRQALYDAGLTKVRARALTRALLEEVQADGGAFFVKPVQGIASYGAFRVTPVTRWSDIEAVTRRLRHDTVYASALGDGLSFLVEDYLPGTEFSFEILVSNGVVFVVAIHEKCQLTETDSTILEDGCTSPPYSIDGATVAKGIEWLRRVFSRLLLTHGCFHVEARCESGNWDLIEINPRVGGSLISPSVKALNGHSSLLDLWLTVLLEGETASETLQSLSYTVDGNAPGLDATYFRVYFASAGRITHIELLPLSREPLVSQILLKEGDVIEQASREVFLGQMLWRLTRSERDAGLDALMRSAAHALDVRYEQDEPDGDTGAHMGTVASVQGA